MYHNSSFTGVSGPNFRDNNFRLLRLLTAFAVAATHCLWVVYGINPAHDWPLGFLIQAAHCGICIFFGLSGYLITASLIERPDMVRYCVSRFLRLCPLLFVAAVLMAFVVGPFVSEVSFSDYYNDWRLWAYVPLTTFAYPDMTLPGVFVNAPSEGEVNISIWTLRYEMIAYVGMALMALLGLISTRFIWMWATAALAGFFYITYFTDLRADIPFINHGLRFGLAFLFGVIFYSYRALIPITIFGAAILIGLAVLTNDTGLMEPFRVLALVYSALWFGIGPLGRKFFTEVRQFNDLGDYSYGIFVFHWPIAQLILQANPGISYGQLLFCVLPLSLLAAVISWHGVEAPILARRTKIAHFVRRIGGNAIAIMAEGYAIVVAAFGGKSRPINMDELHTRLLYSQPARQPDNGGKPTRQQPLSGASYRDGVAPPNVPASQRPFATGYRR